MIKGIIFDLDGVLVFTDHFHYLAWKKLADEEGIYFDETINNRLRGVSRMASLDIILEKATREYSPEEKAKMAERKNSYYLEYIKKMKNDDVSEETRATLTALKAKGLLLAIGSSSKNTKEILKRTDLTSYFDAISDGTNITRSKPDPEVFLAASKMLNLSPSSCVVVEDAVAGIEAAVAGGFLPAGIGEASKDPRTKIRLKALGDLLVAPEIVGGGKNDVRERWA